MHRPKEAGQAGREAMEVATDTLDKVASEGSQFCSDVISVCFDFGRVLGTVLFPELFHPLCRREPDHCFGRVDVKENLIVRQQAEDSFVQG